MNFVSGHKLHDRASVCLSLKAEGPKVTMQVLNWNRQWKNISLRDLLALFYLEHLMGST